MNLNRSASLTKIYRGGTLEELIPRIRAELGRGAIITRQRDGLAGGIAGFFQRRFVEVEAQSAPSGPPGVDVYDDGAPATPPANAPTTAAAPEGSRAPSLGRMFDQPASVRTADAAPAQAPPAQPPPANDTKAEEGPDQAPPADDSSDLAEAPSTPEEPPPTATEPAQGTGPEAPFVERLRKAEETNRAGAVERTGNGKRGSPRRSANGKRRSMDRPANGRPAEADHAPPPPPPVPVPEPARQQSRPGSGLAAPAIERPVEADDLEQKLIASGLSAGLASDLIAEAITHGLPFGTQKAFKRIVRETLARAIPVQGSLGGGGGRTVAFVGAGGSGKTLSAARLAFAYARCSDVPVACLSLRPKHSGELAALLAESNAAVQEVASAEEASRWVGQLPDRRVAVIDTPAVSPADQEGARALAQELSRVTSEIHLALPATLSEPAAEDLVRGLAPLAFAATTLTHVDETNRLGAALGVVFRTRPLSYAGRGSAVTDGFAPADPKALATLLLP